MKPLPEYVLSTYRRLPFCRLIGWKSDELDLGRDMIDKLERALQFITSSKFYLSRVSTLAYWKISSHCAKISLWMFARALERMWKSALIVVILSLKTGFLEWRHSDAHKRVCPKPGC